MEGKDHDGYCSGEDARHHDFIGEYVIRTVDRDTLIESPDDLEWTDDGCTSGGSEYYCHGFYQTYSLNRILDVLDVPNDVTRADIRQHIQTMNRKIEENADEDEDEDADEIVNDEDEQNDED
jgi:hypothetical protein